jgi:hypothetical protein
MSSKASGRKTGTYCAPNPGLKGNERNRDEAKRKNRAGAEKVSGKERRDANHKMKCVVLGLRKCVVLGLHKCVVLGLRTTE